MTIKMGSDDKVYRLLNYKNLLNRLKSIGFVKVFSDNLADTLDISPSLVRKDFREFGIRGAQKGGYTIEAVLSKINEVLGINKKHRIIIVGAGRIGQALMHFPRFQKEGIIITAGFDTDPEKIDEHSDVPIYHVKEMVEFIKKYNIKLAILAVPENAAMGCLDMMESAGIKGILNFTSMNLKSEQIAINNVNIGNEIENLIFTTTKK
jgi:redox-sensing transcriptional repressor